MAASTVAPGRVGEAVRTWIIARRLGGTPDSVAVVLGTVLSQTLVNLVALSLLLAVALSSASFALGPAGGFAPALIVPALAVALAVGGPRLLRLAAKSDVEPLRRSAGWLARELSQVRRGLRAFGDVRTATRTAGMQLVGWALQLATCAAVMLAVHLDAHPMLAAAAAVLVAVNVAAIVPVTPSNVGLFQAACIAALAPFGVPASAALAYGIALQTVEVVSALSLGVPALLAEGLSWSELRERGQAPP
jgi:phosphatidylinositol alpha-mannosyltransferase